MNHCIAKIIELIQHGRNDRRSIFQIGYNLGRMAEITGLGRVDFWDQWRDPIEMWDLPELQRLAQELLKFMASPDDINDDKLF